MAQIAKKTDWKTENMPHEISILDYQRTFSAPEFERIRHGFVPGAMEDKWFIYYDNDHLNMHRSWTGYQIYRITLRHTQEDTYTIVEAIVNRKKEEYNQQDDSYDILLLDYLIDRILLDKKVAFTTPNDLPIESKAVFKHSVVGYATSNGPETVKSYNASRKDKLKGCLVGGAIGDALGSYYEGRKNILSVDVNVPVGLTDDTQLTLATCESILESKKVSPENIAGKFLEWYNTGRLSGLGASTLKALRDLQVGAHWALSGRSGEYAAGNGAAMRIAPLAFFVNISTEKTLIRDVCNITHKNDEAYVGCLSILHALTLVTGNQWGDENLLALITPLIPDTAVKDNLLKLQGNPSLSIKEAAELTGCSGHVIESIPFSLFAAQKIKGQNFMDILSEIIRCGGDTDTNASLAGQVMGAFTGYSGMPNGALSVFQRIKEHAFISQIADKLSDLLPLES